MAMRPEKAHSWGRRSPASSYPKEYMSALRPSARLPQQLKLAFTSIFSELLYSPPPHEKIPRELLPLEHIHVPQLNYLRLGL